MKHKPHIVFLCPTFDYPSPRNLRVKGLLPCLQIHYKISIVALTSESRNVEIEHAKYATIYRAPYSRISRYITNKRYSDHKLNRTLLTASRICSYLLKKYYLFPDVWISEKQNLVGVLSSLEQKPDVLVASMMPFSMADTAIDFLKTSGLKNKVPLILDIGDPLTDNVVKMTHKKSSQVFEYECEILKSADHIVVTNDATKHLYADQFGIDTVDLSVIQQGSILPDWAELADSGSSTLPVKLHYAGLFIDSVRDPRKLFTELSGHTISIKVSVAGSIDQIFQANADHIDFVGMIPWENIDSFYRSADCLLFLDNRSGIQTSGKIYELLATRKPILFCYDNTDSQVKKECEDFGHVIFVKNDAQNLKKKLENLPALIEKSRQWLKSEEGISFKTEQFSWNERAVRFRVVINKLLELH